jgi:hypothetical protein
MSDCPAYGQSGTGMNKNADARTSPVPESGDPVLYRNGMLRYRTEIQDAGGIDLDTDAQLWNLYTYTVQYEINT